MQNTYINSCLDTVTAQYAINKQNYIQTYSKSADECIREESAS